MKCSYCNQDLASAPHAGDKYCPICGQGIDDTADLAALRAENQRLREALQEINRYLENPDIQFAVPLIAIVRAALA